MTPEEKRQAIANANDAFRRERLDGYVGAYYFRREPVPWQGRAVDAIRTFDDWTAAPTTPRHRGTRIR